MKQRKRAEVELADLVLLCSDFQARKLGDRKVASRKVAVAPLWVNTVTWRPSVQRRDLRCDRLKVLFAGKINLRKGVPYLLEAVQKCQGGAELTLVGPIDEELRSMLDKKNGDVTILPPRTKPALRDLYWQSDVLVLPSLGDSFGFVAMEAMACGLPVIVTENCGVPVPDESWRVPVMNSQAIAERLLMYARDRELCQAHGRVAAAFARQFTPELYRQRIRGFYRQLLDQRPA